MTIKHAFEAIDSAVDPESWVGVLDQLHEHPFYRGYKARLREILEPRCDGRYLEVGAGQGADSLGLGAWVVGLDKALTMCRAMRARKVRAVAGLAEELPLESDYFDACWADRTFQHLARPKRALEELVRVTKPGGCIVVVDPDYGTQTLEFPDQDLARRVLDYRADHMLRNGRMARHAAAMFVRAGLRSVEVEPRTLMVRDPESLQRVLGLRSWPRSASRAGFFTLEEVDRWEALYDEVARTGAFCWSITFFTSWGLKPDRGVTHQDEVTSA